MKTIATGPDLWGDDQADEIDTYAGGSPLAPAEAEMEAAVTGRDNEAMDVPDFCVFDGETGPQPEDRLREMCPPFEPDPPPGEFEPGKVKCGNIGGPSSEKGKKKIEDARKDHAESIANYAEDVEKARAEHWHKFVDKAALDATTGRVVAIGVDHGLGPIILDCSFSEEQGLRLWWSTVEDCLRQRCPMVGFNIFHFDLPFFIRRSWILGVPIPAGIKQGRYWSDLFVDLMVVWQQGGRELVSLDTLAKAFGVAGKVKEVGGVEVSGATFYKLWESNRPIAEVYLNADLRIPAELARRMGVV